MRRETRDRRRSSFIHPPEPPGHAADDLTPTQPTLPHKAVRGARARSSQLHLHIARRRRGCRPGRRRHHPSGAVRSSAPPSMTSSEMFCIMLTGSPSATGSAAPAAVKSLVEQPGREATGGWHGDGPSPCHSRLRSGSAATLADFTSASAPEALGGHAFPVGWKRGTLHGPPL